MPSSALSPAAFRVLIAIAATGLLTTSSAHAVDTTLRLQGQLVNSSANVFGLSNDFGSGPGVYFGAEFRLNDRLGIEVGASWIDLEESERQEGLILATEITASVRVVPVTVALDIHLTPQKRYDLYLAPKLGWAFYDDLQLATRFDFGGFDIPGFPSFPSIPGFGDQVVNEFKVEDQFIFGLRLGFDVPFGGSSWSLSSSIDYTDMELELEIFAGTPTAGLDPLSIGVGVAYGF